MFFADFYFLRIKLFVCTGLPRIRQFSKGVDEPRGTRKRSPPDAEENVKLVCNFLRSPVGVVLTREGQSRRARKVFCTHVVHTIGKTYTCNGGTHNSPLGIPVVR